MLVGGLRLIVVYWIRNMDKTSSLRIFRPKSKIFWCHNRGHCKKNKYYAQASSYKVVRQSKVTIATKIEKFWNGVLISSLHFINHVHKSARVFSTLDAQFSHTRKTLLSNVSTSLFKQTHCWCYLYTCKCKFNLDPFIYSKIDYHLLWDKS